MTHIPSAPFALPPIRFTVAQHTFRRDVLAALSSAPAIENPKQAQKLKTLSLLLAVATLSGLIVSGLLQGGWLFAGLTLSQPLYLIAAVGIAHDASHNALSKRAWLNRWGTHVFDALGVNSYIWHFDHVVAHHSAPNVSRYDANLTGWGLRLDPRRPLRWHHAYQHFYAPFIYSLASLFKVFIGDLMAFRRKQVGAYLPGKHRLPEVIRLVVWKLIAISITLLLPLLMNAERSVVIVGYLLGHVVTGLLMGAIFQPTHTNEYIRWPKSDNDGLLEHSFEEHALLTTADFCVDSAWITWISGGLNIHAVHHMFPRLSHVQLTKASQLVAEIAPRHGLRYTTFATWSAALGSHIRALARLGRVAPEDVPEDGNIFDAPRTVTRTALEALIPSNQ